MSDDKPDLASEVHEIVDDGSPPLPSISDNVPAKKQAYSPLVKLKRDFQPLLDADVRLTVEIGRTRRSIADVSRLEHGSVMGLDRLADEPVDICINNRLIGRGRLVSLGDNYGVQVTHITNPQDDNKKKI